MSLLAARRLPALRASRPLLLAARLHSARPARAEAAAKGSEAAANMQYPYIPGGPIIQGNVNDATTFPSPSKTHGSHHWSFERLLSAGLVPMTASAMAVSPTNYPVLDGVLAISLVIHSHIGFDQCFVDYLHPRKFPVLGPTINWTLRAATVGVLVGVYQFNTQDIGLTELVRRTWIA